jgi:hypothetical protein
MNAEFHRVGGLELLWKMEAFTCVCVCVDLWRGLCVSVTEFARPECCDMSETGLWRN